MQYLSSGVQPLSLTSVTGDGVVQLLRNLNDAVGKSNEGARQAIPNANLGDRDLATQKAQLDLMERQTRPISAEACREATVGRGVGSVGGSSTAPATDKAAAEAQDEILKPQSEDQYLGDLAFTTSAPKYCTQADVDNKFPNCKSVGSLPAANIDVASLKFKANKERKLRSMSITAGTDEYKAALEYARMNRPFSGPDINVKAKETPDGKRYLILQRRYNSRVSAVSNIFMDTIGESTAISKNSYLVKQVWDNDDTKADFQEIYPGVEYPEAPSEREIMNLMVKRQFTNKQATADMQAQDDAYFARRQVELLKMNNLLLLKQKDQQEKTNLLLATLISNEIDPVNRKDLLDAARQATQTR